MAEGPTDMTDFLRMVRGFPEQFFRKAALFVNLTALNMTCTLQAKYPLVNSTDMSQDLKEEALDLCLTAVEKSPNDMEEVTQSIKEAMEKKFDGHWHVVAGQSFAFDITHEAYLYVFVAGTMAVLLWKS